MATIGDPCSTCARTEAKGARFRQQQQHGRRIRYAQCTACETAYRKAKRDRDRCGTNPPVVPAPDPDSDTAYRRDPATYIARWRANALADEAEAEAMEPFDPTRAALLRDRAANWRGLITECFPAMRAGHCRRDVA